MDKNFNSRSQELPTDETQVMPVNTLDKHPETILEEVENPERTEVAHSESESSRRHEQEEYYQEKENPMQKAKSFLSLFLPQANYTVTPVLLNLNVLVFIVGLLLGLDIMNPDASRLVDIGANYGPYTLTGEWWRLLTSMFLHGGLVHLLFNMVALVQIGSQLEMLIGKVQFALAYVISGIAGSIASIWWIHPEISVSVGASGAIFGVFGMLLMVLTLERELSWKGKKAIIMNMAVVIGINLLFGMRAGIDNAAHIGGLTAGVILGTVLMFRSSRYITQNYHFIGTTVTTAVAALLLIVFFNVIPFEGQVRYVSTMEEISIKENVAIQAMQALEKSKDNPDANILLPMFATGIDLWEESEILLESIDDVPKQEERRLANLLDYIRLRKLSYQMFHEDLKSGKPLFHEKQQQMLYAINTYVVQLQNNNRPQE